MVLLLLVKEWVEGRLLAIFMARQCSTMKEEEESFNLVVSSSSFDVVADFGT